MHTMRLDIRSLTAAHYERPLIIMGNSHSLNLLPLGKLRKSSIVTMGCNRILESYTPDYLVECDRSAYMDQIDRITTFRGKRLFCTALFDPNRRIRQLPAQELPPFDWYGWREVPTPKKRRLQAMLPAQVVNATSFERPFISAVSIAFPMIQFALIMGANPIGLVGIDLAWPKTGPTHSFGDGRKRGCEPFPKRTYRCFEKLHAWLHSDPDQRIVNLSPVRGIMDTYFERQEFSDFIGGKP